MASKNQHEAEVQEHDAPSTDAFQHGDLRQQFNALGNVPVAGIPQHQLNQSLIIIGTQLTQMKQQIATMNGNFMKMQARMHNVECRFDNSGRCEPTTQIMPLYSLVTNQPIPNFPSTVQALSRLSQINASLAYPQSNLNAAVSRLKSILDALEIPYPPGAQKAVLMNKVRFAIGLRETST
ncbi:hypothetical protein V8E51_018164 [Hyaloscypha variabilis]